MYELLASNHYPTLIIHQISYSFVQLLADFPCTFDNACVFVSALINWSTEELVVIARENLENV